MSAPLFLAIIAIATASLAGQPIRTTDAGPSLRRIESRYYTIYTDVDDDTAKEAVVRLNCMGETYHDRTKDFAGVVRQRLPFYLFRHGGDYCDAGGIEGSDGVFDGTKLMAVAGERPTAATWHVVQHEGFHQFAAAAIGDLPVWVNEGIAEYFGEAQFTGDGFVTGLVPPWRGKRVKQQIANNSFMPIAKLMGLSHEEWNGDLQVSNYDEAWSLVHFLVHANGGQYRPAFENYLRTAGGGHTSASIAFARGFSNSGILQHEWAGWWTSQPDDATPTAYGTALADTMASYAWRSAAAAQPLADFAAITDAAQAGAVATPEAFWLPPGLIRDACAAATRDGATWTVQTTGAAASLSVVVTGTLVDGTIVTAKAAPSAEKVIVSTDVDDTAAAVAEAKSLIANKQFATAHARLSATLQAHPKSPFAAEARALLQQKPNVH